MEGCLQGGGFVPHHGHVVRQVYGRLVGRFTGGHVLGRAHIGAVAHPCGGQALALQNGIGAADGAGGYAQAVGQVALGRQFFAHGYLAIQNRLGQVFGNRLVFGLAAVAQAGGGDELFKGHGASFSGQLLYLNALSASKPLA